MANSTISGLPAGSPADANVLAQEVPGVQTQKITFTQVKTYLNGSFLQIANNLSDLGNLNTALTNLGATSANTANALVRRDASGNFSMGTLTASTINLNAASNPSYFIAGNPIVTQVTANGAVFTNALSGDICIRQVTTSNAIRLGVGSNTSELDILNNSVVANSNLNLLNATNPTLVVGTNTNFAQSTAGGSFFSNGATGDTILRQGDTTKSIRIGVGTGAQASGLDVSLTQVSVNLATLACSGSVTVGVNGTITGTLNVGLGITAGSISLPTTGGTPAPLNYNEENTAFNITVSAPDGANHTVAMTATRIGKIVILNFAGLSVTSNSATRFTAAAGQIPSRFSPTSTVTYFDNATDNGVAVFGFFAIGSDGSFAVGSGVANGNFQNTGTAAALSSSQAYSVT